MMSRTQRRMQAVLFLHGRMGGGDFSTHEMWAFGQDLLGEPWPAYLKMAFKSFPRVDDLGRHLHGHPAFERVESGNGYDGRTDDYKNGLRTRSAMWTLRE